jgi:hypothetical protein
MVIRVYIDVCYVVGFLVGGYENFFFEKSVDFEPWKSRYLLIDEVYWRRLRFIYP